MTRWLLLACCLVPAANGERFDFEVLQTGEIVASVEMSSPGSDWAVEGREAAAVDIKLDGSAAQQVVLYAGPARHKYRIGLGTVTSGPHFLSVERNAAHSAATSKAEAHGADFTTVVSRDNNFAAYANMPYLYARKNTAGKFSDIPLIAYCERLHDGAQTVLQYTVIFSNEDGGTSTRALMARWGRTTDIEYIYRAYLGNDGQVLRSTVQGPGHKELDYAGRRDGTHALLMPVTDNNMVAEAADSPLRFQLAPLLVDLSQTSREEVMDNEPITYQVMAKELEREKKLRKFGSVDGEKISDLRNYLYVDYGATHRDSAFSVTVSLNDGRAFSSDLGRLDYSIWRDGWVRTTVELPPGTQPKQISGIEFRCEVAPPSSPEQRLAHSGSCRLDGVHKVFFLEKDSTPGPSFWSQKEAFTIPTGESMVFRP